MISLHVQRWPRSSGRAAARSSCHLHHLCHLRHRHQAAPDTVLQMGLKLSDIRATSLPMQEAVLWAQRLEEEFFRQVGSRASSLLGH